MMSHVVFGYRSPILSIFARFVFQGLSLKHRRSPFGNRRSFDPSSDAPLLRGSTNAPNKYGVRLESVIKVERAGNLVLRERRCRGHADWEWIKVTRSVGDWIGSAAAAEWQQRIVWSGLSGSEAECGTGRPPLRDDCELNFQAGDCAIGGEVRAGARLVARRGVKDFNKEGILACVLEECGIPIKIMLAGFAREGASRQFRKQDQGGGDVRCARRSHGSMKDKQGACEGAGLGAQDQGGELLNIGLTFRARQSRVPMAGRKVKVLEGDLGQLKSNFVEKISAFEGQFASVYEKMDGKFVVVEEMLKKLLEEKSKTMVTNIRAATGGQGSVGNPNLFRGRENQEVKILEGEDGMPPLEPLSREEMSRGDEQRDADFARRGVEYECRDNRHKTNMNKAEIARTWKLNVARALMRWKNKTCKYTQHHVISCYLTAIIQNIDFTMLKWRHSSSVNIQTPYECQGCGNYSQLSFLGPLMPMKPMTSGPSYYV
ncbi:hypothetical protein M5K25_026015 [Dendrobium thyrsiflorum]|uniref:Uncharacterized protein n=1 Tax=Dendrobium thyrsiflorum TaxID=117978 RepID=A0ABD0TW86_DENTH